jgi:hypothetical protein
VNAINDKSRPNLTTNIHDSSGYAWGAAQIPYVNTINGKSCPNLNTNIHNSSGYWFFRLRRRRCPNSTCEHN